MDNGGCPVVYICYIILVGLILLMVCHVGYPGFFRRLLYMGITAFANRNREALPPKEISQRLGLDDEELDKNLLNISQKTVDEESNSSKEMQPNSISIQLLHKIDKQAKSVDDLLDKVENEGVVQYCPILRQLIVQENTDEANRLRVIYEALVSFDRHRLDAAEREFRKENLLYLIDITAVQDGKWRFYRALIAMCFQENDYDQVIAFSQKAIASIDETDEKSKSFRNLLYQSLGAIYFERKQYQFAIPYFMSVTTRSELYYTALFVLAFIYIKIFQNYDHGLYYAQLCFASLPDTNTDGSVAKIEHFLLGWIAYCSVACHEYEKGCMTLENSLSSPSAKRTVNEQIQLKTYLSYLLVKCERHAEAENMVEDVLSTEPRNATALNVRGMCEMRNGNYLVAARCFSSIIDDFKEETSKQSKYFLGEIYNNLAICEAYLGCDAVSVKYFHNAFECGYPNVAVSVFAKVTDIPLGVDVRLGKGCGKRRRKVKVH